ncbi:hypothetical protein HUB98_12840 [Paenibacillus barcinonensis]|uniref:Uncharacterized protein n=1 Tax=Paenibacillus barcinonensis TaxID=198119 RepID=A0ABX6Q4K6_PAEBA|nr:hypothetical protein [Paenibacillus barcinonensis]QKS57114.1 hypothetical protein HUB98_12840 [Paenibacillus barcinonensis]
MRAIVIALKMAHAAAGIPQQHGLEMILHSQRIKDSVRMIIIFVLMQLFLLNTTFVLLYACVMHL